MSELKSEKVIPIQPAKQNRFQAKPRIEAIHPTMIVDVWRLLDRLIKDTATGYPDLTEEDPKRIQYCLLNYLQATSFRGLLLKIGKRPVGMMIGDIQRRPYGKPEVFAFVHSFWIEPEYRKQGLVGLLYKDYFARLKAEGVHYWESWANDALTETLTAYRGYSTKKLFNRIGGKF